MLPTTRQCPFWVYSREPRERKDFVTAFNGVYKLWQSLCAQALPLIHIEGALLGGWHRAAEQFPHRGLGPCLQAAGEFGWQLSSEWVLAGSARLVSACMLQLWLRGAADRLLHARKLCIFWNRTGVAQRDSALFSGPTCVALLGSLVHTCCCHHRRSGRILPDCFDVNNSTCCMRTPMREIVGRAATTVEMPKRQYHSDSSA
jgi:hypothetical protein